VDAKKAALGRFKEAAAQHVAKMHGYSVDGQALNLIGPKPVCYSGPLSGKASMTGRGGLAEFLGFPDLAGVAGRELRISVRPLIVR